VDHIDSPRRQRIASYDNDLTAVRRALAGPTAAVWLAASLTIHHLAELDAHQQANPPSLWRELRRIVAWHKPQPATNRTVCRTAMSRIGEHRNTLAPKSGNPLVV
jgi:hypothetical protein